MMILMRVKSEYLSSTDYESKFILSSDNFDDAQYSPFSEIITLIGTVIGVGGLTKIIEEIVKKTSKKITIKTDMLGNLEMDCTNCSPKEVKDLLGTIGVYISNKEDK